MLKQHSQRSLAHPRNPGTDLRYRLPFMPWYAHSASARDRWEPLHRHLAGVAERAAELAAPFGAAEEARLAGLLHDLGKYSDRFTARLEGKARGLDHWSAGARAAAEQQALAAAFAIHGHHVGLPSLGVLGENRPLPGLVPTEPEPHVLLQRLAGDGFQLTAPSPPLLSVPVGPRVAAMLDVRMLFSTLVDADFLETEAHFRGDGLARHYREPGAALRPEAALARLLDHLQTLARERPAASHVQSVRTDLLAACLAAAEAKPGLFTLSAPTGSGKTLALLAFALRHVAIHGLRRIVLAIPYLSILEQTVGIYRNLLAPLFGEEYVLEHHSLAGTRGVEPPRDAETAERRRARELTENWDAPLVVTTSVQLLESLFANRPGACRKLHRLAGSVILFDEVQTLPSLLAVPTLAALSRLARRYDSTVVFATATQPAFSKLDPEVEKLAGSGWQPREIAPPPLRLFDRSRRTRVLWDLEPASWDVLTGRLAGAGRGLCIVNLKRHALELVRRLRELGVPGLFHLSTNLCPAHRQAVLAGVRSRLDSGEPCLLISTQCVEAGVDVDFPVVWRALAPLESIAQAAGRCNRNGRLEIGEVRVFVPEEDRYPDTAYQTAARLARSFAGADLDDPQTFRRYYEQLYELGKTTEVDFHLLEAFQGLDFPSVAELYRLIRTDAVSVVVPWDPEAFAGLRRQIAEVGHLTRGWVQRARPHTVSLYRPKPEDPLWNFFDPVPLEREKKDRRQDWFFLVRDEGYDRELLGLLPAEGCWIA